MHIKDPAVIIRIVDKPDGYIKFRAILLMDIFLDVLRIQANRMNYEPDEEWNEG